MKLVATSTLVAVAVTCLVASGCDEIWDLEYIEPPPACPSPIGHDEDDDRADDACDICPGISDLQTADRDDDGVGDACDPTPAVAGDSKLKFFAFAKSTDRDHWEASENWTVDADAFVHVDVTPAAGSYVTMLAPPPTVPFEVQLAVTLDVVNRDLYNQVVFYGNHGADVSCAFLHVEPPGSGNVWTATPSSSDAVIAPATYYTGTSYVARMTFTATGVSCRIEGETATGDALIGTSTAPLSNPAAGIIAINITNTQLRLHWLAFYKLP